MPDSNNGRHSRKVSVFDPQSAATQKLSQITVSPHLDEETLKDPRQYPLELDEATIQVQVRIPLSEHARPAPLLDEATTTLIDRKQLFAEVARLEKSARHSPGATQEVQKALERTAVHPQITDYLPHDIRPTIATRAIGEQTIADQDVVQIGSWHECIVEVDDQLCLIVPIEIARSGLLKPGKRLVVRIRALEE